MVFFGVIRANLRVRQSFALDFCFLIAPLRTKNFLITLLRQKIGAITYYAIKKGFIAPLRQPITPPLDMSLKLEKYMGDWVFFF